MAFVPDFGGFRRILARLWAQKKNHLNPTHITNIYPHAALLEREGCGHPRADQGHHGNHRPFPGQPRAKMGSFPKERCCQATVKVVLYDLLQAVSATLFAAVAERGN